MMVFELIKKLHDIISKQYSGIWKWIKRILFIIRSWFFDIQYYGVPRSVWEKILEEWRNNILPKLHYEFDTFDCDDYAMYFASWAKMKAREMGYKANGFGMALGTACVEGSCGGHAWNIAIVDNDIVFAEPQLGEELAFDNKEKVYRASDKVKYWLEAVII